MGKIVRENMAFPNSKSDLAIQIADLLASGVRRCLRSGFSDNRLASTLLGSLMVSNSKDKFSIQLLGFHDHEERTDRRITEIVTRMNRSAKGILLHV